MMQVFRGSLMHTFFPQSPPRISFISFFLILILLNTLTEGEKLSNNKNLSKKIIWKPIPS